MSVERIKKKSKMCSGMGEDGLGLISRLPREVQKSRNLQKVVVRFWMEKMGVRSVKSSKFPLERNTEGSELPA